MTLTPAQKAAKSAYDKAWAACQAFAPTDWSAGRKKAYREARDAWHDFLQTLKLDATGRTRTNPQNDKPPRNAGA